MNFTAHALSKLRIFSNLSIIIFLIWVTLVNIRSVYSAVPVTHIVNDAGDAEDSIPGDGDCATADNKCTLRAAIQESSSRSGPDIIVFSSDFIIEPATQLPNLNDPASGTTIRANSSVILQKSSSSGAVTGLVLVSNNNIIQGLKISGFYYGLYISGDNNLVGTNGDGNNDSSEGNNIVNNDEGINITGSNNRVAGNSIGYDMVAASTASNSTGIRVEGDSNRIGTDGNGNGDAEEGNLISGNSYNGIYISGDKNIVAGNYIGANLAGDAAIPNGANGVEISGQYNVIGTNGDGVGDSVEGNLISGNNNGVGVRLPSSNAKNNTIAGNKIGTNLAGDSALPNYNGVLLSNGASHNWIGTNKDGQSDTTERNLIAGNTQNGISISSSGTWQNQVYGNYVGVNATASAPLPNGLYGVYLSYGANTNYIGTLGYGNVIAGNNLQGILVSGSGTDYNQINGNHIGTDPTGVNNLANGEHGIKLMNSVSYAYINNNQIAFNTLDGIFVDGSAGAHIGIQENSILSNGGLGIDLAPDGVTVNDPGDIDSGVNELQNYPILSAATTLADSLTITGTLNSQADTYFNLEFFGSQSCDPSGYGEGQIYLGETWVTTDSQGNASFAETFTYALPDYYITTTATQESTQNTSEFSECRQVETIIPPPTLSIADATVTEGDSGVVNASFMITLSKASSLPVSASYSTTNDSAEAGSDYIATSESLTIPPGETSSAITIAVIGDQIDENDETFSLTLSNPVNAALADGQAIGTIIDDDGTPSLRISDVMVIEGDTGITNANFTVSLSHNSASQVTVTYNTIDGTAESGNDYYATSGTLTFMPGDNRKTISIRVLGDTLDENDETFTVTLSQVSNATLGDGQGTCTIKDDDSSDDQIDSEVYLPLLAR